VTWEGRRRGEASANNHGQSLASERGLVRQAPSWARHVPAPYASVMTQLRASFVCPFAFTALPVTVMCLSLSQYPHILHPGNQEEGGGVDADL